MNKETTLKLLYKFVDRNRKNLCKPFSQKLKIGGIYYCATDAHVVICIPQSQQNNDEDIDIYYTNNYIKPPNIDGILPEFSPVDIYFNYFMQLYNNVPEEKRFIMEECEACDGLGSFRHFGHSYECKSCDEKGRVQTTFTEMVKGPNTVIKFKNVCLPLPRITYLMEVAKALNNPAIVFKIMAITNSTVWFKLDEILVCISGKMIDDDDEKPTIINFEFNKLPNDNKTA